MYGFRYFGGGIAFCKAGVYNRGIFHFQRPPFPSISTSSSPSKVISDLPVHSTIRPHFIRIGVAAS